jgi:hypothetical protein
MDPYIVFILFYVASMCLPFVFIRDFPVLCTDLGYCLDGGFSNDAPCLDSYTITVSALHREADIIPVMTARKDIHTYTSSNHLKASSSSSSATADASKSVVVVVENDDGEDDCEDKDEDDEDDNEDVTSVPLPCEESFEDTRSIAITPLDIIRVPSYPRVWQVGDMGMVSYLY